MVTPISGPFVKVQELPGSTAIGMDGFRPHSFYIYRRWFRQRKPHNLPLPYEFHKRLCSSFYDPFPPNYRDYTSAPTYDEEHSFKAVNSCYSKFVDKASDPSQWAVNLVEMKKTLDLVTGPLGVLIKATKQIRKFHFADAAYTLGITKPHGLKNDSQFFGKNWLAFHFGVEPLVKDIHAGLDTLTRDFQPKAVNVRARISKSFGFKDPGKFWSAYRGYQTTGCAMRGQIVVTNPNLFLASQLGLTNPASWVWELIPFSFVVDWFTNVGQVLSSWTDFAGASIQNASTTIYQTQHATESTWYGLNAQYASTHMFRSPGISLPVLSIRPWKGVSVVRAATAVSLLLQQLR